MIRKQQVTPARLDKLDFLRGLAILGMLVANVPWHVGNSMSRVIEADFTSTAAWLLQYLIFDQRFMPIFCLLFGAAYWVLFQRARCVERFRITYAKRMLVLLLLGVCHAYLLWPGDILITYAVCGLLLLLFHHASITTLLLCGCAFKGIDLLFGQWPGLYEHSIEALFFSWWVDYGDAPIGAAAAYAGSYSDLFAYNAWRNQFLQWTALPYFRVWNALGLMLLGLAAYRTGVLQGHKSVSFYRRSMCLCLLCSLPLVLYGVLARIGINQEVGAYLGFSHTLPVYNLTFRLGCTLMSFAVIAAVHLLWPRLAVGIKSLFINVGKMALTNYLLQSVFFILLMHIVGLYAFDSLDHDNMLVWVLVMWLVHVIFSQFWLAYFSQGPIEWFYRRLCR